QCWPDDLDSELYANLQRLEKLTGRTFGVGAQPLLIAVRSGAAQSMPGMMDTLLNVGLNAASVAAMAPHAANPRRVWEGYLHFCLMYSHTVGGIENDALTQIVQTSCKSAGKVSEDELDAVQLEALCDRLREFYAEKTRCNFPTDPWAMLCASINAVFLSWN